MIVKKTKFKNGREIYRKADFLEKIKVLIKKVGKSFGGWQKSSTFALVKTR